MIRFLYILAKHGINPFSKIDDIAISKMRYRLSTKEKYQLLKYAKSNKLKKLQFFQNKYWQVKNAMI